jgi:predicted TIM-barrel fold metal-dependent hydrolase
MTHTDQLADAARGLDGHDDLTVVVEHTGWPTSASDDEFAAWKTGIDALAAVGDNVVCKLSGLAMPLGAMTVDAFRPWVEHALEAFGARRCMFASNFPVDGMHGSLDQLLTVMSDLVDARDHEDVFAATAERVYRL